MSRQSEAKESQGYSKKPANCGNCVNFKSEMTSFPPSYYWPEGQTLEKNLRCGIGGFAVARNGNCTLWDRAAPENSTIAGGVT